MNRKTMLIGANHLFLMFGTTVYVGVLWALHFFWYPSWEVMNVGNVQDHFILPTSAATKFFTIIVPIMFLCSGVMIRLGRVRDNRMVDMQLTNTKLVDRGVKMVMEKTGLSYEEANSLLSLHRSVRKAIDHFRLNQQ